MQKGELIAKMEPLLNLEQAFIDQVWAHDVTYNYSDDNRVWNEGAKAMTRIRELAKLLPDPKRAQMIWNARMDSYINSDLPGVMDRWYDSLLGPSFGK